MHHYLAAGYFSSAHVVYNSDSYKDKGPIWLTGVECQGSESRLVDCASVQYTGLASGSCHHNNDVGVTCGGTYVYIRKYSACILSYPNNFRAALNFNQCVQSCSDN